MRIAIKTLGCKANRYESDKLCEILSNKYEVFGLNEGHDFDVLVVNTCTVTHGADRKSRQAVRSVKNSNPSCKVVVFGCGAIVSHGEYEVMEEVDFVAQKPEEVVEFVDSLAVGSSESDISCGMRTDSESAERTRALVKIQDGCNNYCAYCIIPRARGPEVSFSSKRILEEVQKKEAAGFREIVLTGIIMSNWEEDGKNLADLIEMLIENTENVRFRVSSFEPKDFSNKFLGLFETGRLCPHIHMSLQSGSDGVLGRMRRHYDTELFFDACQKLRKVVPDIGLTTDVIVGFPGETDEEFEETCDFVQKIGFLKMHVFPYSKRKNTAAYYMSDQVPEDVKKKRAKILREISDEMGVKFVESVLGREYDVLVETCENGVCGGFTSNYVAVQFLCSGTGFVDGLGNGKDLANKVVKVRLDSIEKNGLVKAVLVSVL